MSCGARNTPGVGVIMCILLCVLRTELRSSEEQHVLLTIKSLFLSQHSKFIAMQFIKLLNTQLILETSAWEWNLSHAPFQIWVYSFMLF